MLYQQKTLKELKALGVTHSFSEMVSVLLDAGFTYDFVPSFNVLKNGRYLVHVLPSEYIHTDFLWLCNQIANAHKAVENDPCTDNYRFCVGPEKSEVYFNKRRNGCCGASDTLLKNPQSGNCFWYGFNYGH
jgi:hypothetical protein